MIALRIQTKNIVDSKNQALIVFVEQDQVDSMPIITHLEKERCAGLRAAAQHQHFYGKTLQSFAMVGTEGTAVDIILVGLGAKNTQGIIPLETYRRALGKAVRIAESRKDNTVASLLPPAEIFGITDALLAQETTVIAHMAVYRFAEYITDKERVSGAIASFELFLDGHTSKSIQEGVDRGTIIADAVNTTRHWIDLPPMRLTPVQLADHAQEIAREYGLKLTRFAEQEVRDMGMGGLAGVSSGSDQDCQFVVLEYRTTQPNAPTVAFVGKGITFDSGGLSIKPALNMETMKDDMSGAAAVISVMRALAQLKPNINVIGITPLSENLPSGKATKPGDILTFYNGKTAEVKNTDAEGRLILADALSYAVKHYTLDAILDVATLTGACAYALGPFFTGMLSQHDELANRVQQSAERSGDRVWPLPLHDDYKAAIKSEVADICNIGSSKYMAGTITAAFFLQNFVNDTPWVHLDIAGTAFDVPDLTYYRSASATGASVRLLIDLAMTWEK